MLACKVFDAGEPRSACFPFPVALCFEAGESELEVELHKDCREPNPSSNPAFEEVPVVKGSLNGELRAGERNLD